MRTLRSVANFLLLVSAHRTQAKRLKEAADTLPDVPMGEPSDDVDVSGAALAGLVQLLERQLEDLRQKTISPAKFLAMVKSAVGKLAPLVGTVGESRGGVPTDGKDFADFLSGSTDKKVSLADTRRFVEAVTGGRR